MSGGGGWSDRTSTSVQDITVFGTDRHANLASLHVGADSRNRAGSLLGGSQALCQLSYVRVVHPGGFEPPSPG